MELYVRNREEWRKWLEECHNSIDGIWLIYYKKSSGKPRIPYNDALDEALCFGWIDSKIKRVNDDYYIQWFTPRRRGSRWSKLNITKVEKLIKEGRMRPEGLSLYEEALKKPQLVYDIKKEDNIIVPDDLQSALTENKVAFENFNNFPPSSRRLYVLWLNDAKRAETRRSRIVRIVDNSGKNIKAGMM
jgi:uncharacterized protein YdeI (YjbR/CyaY-like superfamily)